MQIGIKMEYLQTIIKKRLLKFRAESELKIPLNNKLKKFKMETETRRVETIIYQSIQIWTVPIINIA